MKSIRFFIISVICISFTAICTQCDKKEKNDFEILTNKTEKSITSKNNLRAPSIPDNPPWGLNRVWDQVLKDCRAPKAEEVPNCYDEVPITDREKITYLVEFERFIDTGNSGVGEYFSNDKLWTKLFPALSHNPEILYSLSSGKYYLHKIINEDVRYYRASTDKLTNPRTVYLTTLSISF